MYSNPEHDARGTQPIHRGAERWHSWLRLRGARCSLLLTDFLQYGEALGVQSLFLDAQVRWRNRRSKLALILV